MQTISEIHAAYLEKKTSPQEVVQDYLARVQQSPLNAFLTVSSEKAIEQARRAQALFDAEDDLPGLLARFPLLGVPVGIKDNLVTEGIRTTCASRMLENYVPPYTATTVRLLEQAGAVVLGKCNLDEFSMGGSNENSAYGFVDHPTHPGRVPGGSSGGPAAAVRAGLCVAALGSDTGGSIRLPASFCGIVGLKPTYGTVSRFGLIAFASSLDQVGPMTQTVGDLALMMDLIAGHDPQDSTSVPVGPNQNFVQAARAPLDRTSLRVGVPEEYFGEGLDPEVESAVRDALHAMEKKGARLVPVRLPHTRYAVAVYYVIAVSEASSNLARYDGVRFGVRSGQADSVSELGHFYELNREGFGSEVKRRILLGTFALSSGYYDAYYQRACQVRRLIQQDFENALTQVDVLVSPVSTSTAFRRGEKSSDPLKMYLNDSFTVPANLAGIPALSIPCGQDSNGLPIGLQFMGAAFSDARLVAIASAFEREILSGRKGASA